MPLQVTTKAVSKEWGVFCGRGGERQGEAVTVSKDFRGMGHTEKAKLRNAQDRGGTGNIETQRNESGWGSRRQDQETRRLSIRSLRPMLKGTAPVGARSPVGKVYLGIS